MNKQQASKNQRRQKRKLNFIATMAHIIAITGFNGHFAPRNATNPIFMPTRSQRIKSKRLSLR